MEWEATLGALTSLDLDALLLSATDVRGLFAVLAGIIVFLYGISVGKTKAILSLLSIYVAYALTLLFPLTHWLEQFAPEDDRPLVITGLFVVLYLAVFGLLNLSVLKRRLTLGELSIPKVLLISIVQIGLLASVVISLLPEGFSNETLEALKPYLAGRGALFAWAVLAIIVLPFMREKRRTGGMTQDG